MTLIVAQCVDPNAGLTTRADFFALVTVGLDPVKRRFHVLDCLHGRWDTTEHPRLVTEEYREWKDRTGAFFYKVGVQTIFYETDLFKHLLHDSIVPIKEIPRRAGSGTGALNKYLTLLNLQSRWQRGQIVLPGIFEEGAWKPDYAGHPWLKGLEEELLSISFVNGAEAHKHDDRAEALALCVEMLANLLTSGNVSNTGPTYSPVRIG